MIDQDVFLDWEQSPVCGSCGCGPCACDHPEPTFTTDPNTVTRVVWYIASESVCDWSEDTDSPIDGPHDDDRMSSALGHLYDEIQREYPNCSDIYVANGGYDNQYANSSPRCETADDSIYEPFYDDLTRWEDQSIAHAFTQYP